MKSTVRRYSQRARAQAAADTGRRIVDAFLARLMTQWFDEITLNRVAADAGVTVQTVVRRFGSKEGLLSRAVETLASWIRAQRAAPPGDLDRLIENLIGDYERTGDTIIRLLSLEPRHPSLKTFLDLGRRGHRQWAATAFAELLDQLAPAAARRALDALVISTDVYTWKLLRRDMGHGLPATAATLKALIQGTMLNFQNENIKTNRNHQL
jgi:AcrR family transcriptional regulator